MNEKRARSDMWRAERHANKAREIAYVTRGISDYFGSACHDRGYSVTWKPFELAAGATDTKSKRVVFDTGRLAGVTAPFSGAFVDHLLGVAAHESGHVAIASAFGNWTSRDPLANMIRNVVEDFAIDFDPMRHYNAGLGDLTRSCRDDMHEEQAARITEYWNLAPALITPIELIKLWACARLMKCEDSLTLSPKRIPELKAIARLDPVGDLIIRSHKSIVAPTFGNDLASACAAIATILRDYTNDTQADREKQEQEKREREEKREQAEQEKQEHADEDESGESEPSNERGQSGQSDSEDEEQEPSDGDSEPNADSDSESGDSDEDESGSPTDAPSTGSSSGKSDSADSDEESDEASAGSAESDEDSDSDEAADSADEESKSGSASDWGGSASDNADDFTGSAPEPCMRDEASEDDSETSSAKLWDQVAREAAVIEAARPAIKGSRDAARTLRPYTERKIVAAIGQAYAELASEPTRRRRLDSGKIDRKRIAFADSRDDIFAQQSDRELDGTLALIIDLSASMGGRDEMLAKQAAASVYVALKSTPIDCYVYSYGDPVCVQLATPDRVIDFDTVHANGGTPTAQAIERVIEDVKPRGQSVILHVTDGTPESPARMLAAMKTAQALGWIMINVIVNDYITSEGSGYGEWANELRGASDAFASLSTYAKLPKVIAQVVSEIVNGGKRSL